jgi:hypothetical protein
LEQAIENILEAGDYGQANQEIKRIMKL